MPEAETTVLLVYVEYLYFYVGPYLGKLRRVLDFLGPRKVGYVDKPVYTLLYFYKYAEVGKVANFGGMACPYCIFGFDILPGIGFELSVSITASTSSPTFIKSCALRRCCDHDISDTWIRPSTPGAISMNAP